jgi:hypothetical protein
VTIPAVVAADSRYQSDARSLTPTFEPFELHLPTVWHLDGIPWWQASPPPRRHRHWPQSVGDLDALDGETWRCPCGAFGRPAGGWVLLDRARIRPTIWRRWLPRARKAAR